MKKAGRVAVTVGEFAVGGYSFLAEIEIVGGAEYLFVGPAGKAKHCKRFAVAGPEALTEAMERLVAKGYIVEEV